jgi:hypothetical protein
LVLADPGPTTFQHLYGPIVADRDPAGYPLSMFAPFREQALLFRERGELPNYRIFWARGSIHPFMATSLLQHNCETPSPHASYSGDLRAASTLTDPFERYLNDTVDKSDGPDNGLFDGEIADVVVGGLGMLDTKYLLYTRADTVRSVDLPEPTPILVCPRIAGLA